MFNPDQRIYDVEFNISSFTAESAAFALLATLPMIKEARFRFEAIDDERFREIEHVLNSIGVSICRLDKTVAEATLQQEEPEEEEGVDFEAVPAEKRIGAMLDNLLHQRQTIYDTVDSDLPDAKKQKEVSLSTRDFHTSVAGFMEEMKKQIVESLMEDAKE